MIAIPFQLNPNNLGRLIFQRLDHIFNLVFGAKLNPLCNLGALGFLFFWIIVISGIYLYAMLDTSVTGAYQSINDLSLKQRYLGGLLRSLHHYAADGFIIVMVIHLIREWVFGHYQGFRRFSWLTGVPLILFAFACGIGGFWLNWDQLGQFSAQATAEWLDAIPLFASPLTRNFLSINTVSDRLFSLFVFIHLGLPLLLLFGLWFHIQRISFANIFPPRTLSASILVTLFALALLSPVLSHPPADLAFMPTTLTIDWILLFSHPLMYVTSPVFLWGLLVSFLAILLLLPFLPRRNVPPIAKVDPNNCNGCQRCFDDCPYAAITMISHPNHRFAKQMAMVDPDLCASCGICVGACPSSTPFRSVTKLVSGIDLPHSPITHLRAQLKKSLAHTEKAPRIVVFGCDHGVRVDTLRDPDICAFSLTCIGMLPPSFIDYALRDGASAVLISGCQSTACEFRLGQRWTENRILGTREPTFRNSAFHLNKIQVSWANVGEEATLRIAIEELKKNIGFFQKFIPPSEITQSV